MFVIFQPPENELQKVGERVPSEHELRVQRSLQRLNVPDWYKNSPAAREGGGGFRLKRHSDASQHGGWRALGSKTTSLSSLSSSSNRQPATGIETRTSTTRLWAHRQLTRSFLINIIYHYYFHHIYYVSSLGCD